MLLVIMVLDGYKTPGLTPYGWHASPVSAVVTIALAGVLQAVDGVA